jgi:hypothetical protein
MGVFVVDVRVARPGRHPRWRTLRRVMVDTGAEMTWLPESELRAAGIDDARKKKLVAAGPIPAAGAPRT